MAELEKKQQKQRMQKTISILKKLYPSDGTALKFDSVFQLTIAVILSAQCTDVRVNMVTKELFKKHKTPEDFVKIPQTDLEKIIYSTGFYHAKAKNIKGMAKIVHEKYKNKVPKTMNELLELPGVARKTANIVLSEGYGIIDGIAVDTHVRRLSNRLGFTAFQNPEIIERDLMGLVPKSEWWNISNMLIWHGRKVCASRKPKCADCKLNKLCPSAFVF
ncbi:MAG: endonuclease III [archaeon]|nr:endonuclease III [archaeon]